MYVVVVILVIAFFYGLAWVDQTSASPETEWIDQEQSTSDPFGGSG